MPRPKTAAKTARKVSLPFDPSPWQSKPFTPRPVNFERTSLRLSAAAAVAEKFLAAEAPSPPKGDRHSSNPNWGPPFGGWGRGQQSQKNFSLRRLQALQKAIAIRQINIGVILAANVGIDIFGVMWHKQVRAIRVNFHNSVRAVQSTGINLYWVNSSLIHHPTKNSIDASSICTIFNPGAFDFF